jgi:hypothetical protein
MPITWERTAAERLTIVVHEGAVNDEEFLESYRRIFTDPDFDPSCGLLVDLRQADSTTRNPQTLRQFAGLFRQRFDGQTVRPRVAVVAPSNVSFGLARLFGAHSGYDEEEFGVFRDLDAAFAWLR